MFTAAAITYFIAGILIVMFTKEGIILPRFNIT